MSAKVDGKTECSCGAVANVGTETEQLANALQFEKAKNEVLLGEVVALEDAIVNRCMEDFNAVVSDETRNDWRELLLTNRDMAIGLLTELARAKQGLAAGGAVGRDTLTGSGQARRPLHNRSVVRPVAPAGVGGGGTGGGSSAGSGQASEADDRAAKIRNRAHEISKVERVPFSAAFRRAEREISGQ